MFGVAILKESATNALKLGEETRLRRTAEACFHHAANGFQSHGQRLQKPFKQKIADCFRDLQFCGSRQVRWASPAKRLTFIALRQLRRSLQPDSGLLLAMGGFWLANTLYQLFIPMPLPPKLWVLHVVLLGYALMTTIAYATALGALRKQRK